MINHNCLLPTGAVNGGWGHAILECFQAEGTRMFAGNDEYMSQVNYCPFCGQKATIQIDMEKKVVTQ